MLLALLFLLPLVSAKTCPLHAVDSPEYNTCYLLIKAPAFWSAAEGICQNIGGHLASIKDQQQNDYIYNLVKSVYGQVWIGANIVNNTWTNSDGTPFAYNKFPGALSNPYRHTVATFVIGTDSGTWNITSDDIYNVSGFICELPRCNADGSSPPSLLTPDQWGTGMVYGQTTNSWYYGAPHDACKISEGESACVSMGGHLPSLANAYQNSDLMSTAVVLGMSRIGLSLHASNGGTWSWYDGSNSTYTNWAPDEPYDNQGVVTYFLTSTGLWYATIDFQRVPYVCEFPTQNRNYC